MTQSSVVMPTSGPMSMATFVTTYLNPGLQSLFTNNAGSSAPTDGIGAAPATYQWWWDSSASPSLLKVYDGTQWVTVGWLDTVRHIFASGREVLAANRTYYVRTDGSDSNTGLANTAGGAFLTIQHAANIVWRSIDLAGFNIDVQIGDGTYSQGVFFRGPAVTAGGIITFRGNASTPTNVVVNGTGAFGTYTFDARYGAVVYVKDLQVGGAGGGLQASEAGQLHFTNVVFAASPVHILVGRAGTVTADGSYSISGGATTHWLTESAGSIIVENRTITLTGTPAFSLAFAYGIIGGIFVARGNTFSGGATGKRYDIANNSVLDTNGAGATYLPGDSAGSSATGAQYN